MRSDEVRVGYSLKMHLQETAAGSMINQHQCVFCVAKTFLRHAKNFKLSQLDSETFSPVVAYLYITLLKLSHTQTNSTAD